MRESLSSEEVSSASKNEVFVRIGEFSKQLVNYSCVNHVVRRLLIVLHLVMLQENTGMGARADA